MNRFSRVTQKLPQYLFFALVVLIPFSMRHVFSFTWNYQTGAYSDFTSLSLYISDLVLIAFISMALFFQKEQQLPKLWKYTALFTILWLILELFIQDRSFFPLQLYFSVRIVLLIAFAASLARFHVSREKLAWLFTLLAGLQSIIAIVQFYCQRSIGLYYFGESHLGPDIFGVAKIVSHGTKLIRGYGTFPHSNLLSAFLVAGIGFNLYLITKTYQIPRGQDLPRGEDPISRGTWSNNWLLYLFLALNTFGLFITFSRAGILALGVIGVIYLIFFAYLRHFKWILKVLAPAAIFILLAVAVLAPYLSTRATISDNSTKERLFYSQIGEKIVKNKPIFGIGPGTSVLHMKQYSGEDLAPWDIQPVHNYYLLSWVELGIGSIGLLTLIILPIILLIMRKKDIWTINLVAINLAFLSLFLFDHYFYTIWPTQLLLWLIIGLTLQCFTWNNKNSA